MPAEISVHFLDFGFPPGAVEAWKRGEGSAMLVIDHPNYGHAAIIGKDSRDYLAFECFD